MTGLKDIGDIKPRAVAGGPQSLRLGDAPLRWVRVTVGRGVSGGTYLDVQVVVVPLGQLDEDGEQ